MRPCLDRHRPQPPDPALELGDVAGGEDRRIARAHAVVDDDAAADLELCGAGEIDVRAHAGADEEQIGRQRLPILELHLLDAAGAAHGDRLRLHQDGEPEPFVEEAAHEGAAAFVELVVEQTLRMLEHGDADAELVQRIRRPRGRGARRPRRRRGAR